MNAIDYLMAVGRMFEDQLASVCRTCIIKAPMHLCLVTTCQPRSHDEGKPSYYYRIGGCILSSARRTPSRLLLASDDQVCLWLHTCHKPHRNKFTYYAHVLSSCFSRFAIISRTNWAQKRTSRDDLVRSEVCSGPHGLRKLEEIIGPILDRLGGTRLHNLYVLPCCEAVRSI